jgi:hypothetical protein
VDAQDITGKWYEAVVREVSEDTVKVHYLGWASRWDASIRRHSSGPPPERVKPVSTQNHSLHRQVMIKLKFRFYFSIQSIRPPAPLWTHTQRWRESLQLGQFVEIRDSTSRADRPKWYKGIIKAISNVGDPLNDILGGADLETFCLDEDGIGKKQPLLLLNRSRQVRFLKRTMFVLPPLLKLRRYPCYRHRHWLRCHRNGISNRSQCL